MTACSEAAEGFSCVASRWLFPVTSGRSSSTRRWCLCGISCMWTWRAWWHGTTSSKTSGPSPAGLWTLWVSHNSSESPRLLIWRSHLRSPPVSCVRFAVRVRRSGSSCWTTWHPSWPTSCPTAGRARCSRRPRDGSWSGTLSRRSSTARTCCSTWKQVGAPPSQKLQFTFTQQENTTRRRFFWTTQSWSFHRHRLEFY